MNKKIKNLFLAGAVLVGLAGVSVSCTDYSKDIDELRDENAELSKTVKELQEKLKSGSVIESVTTTSDGLVITVDGKSYTITNGQSGTSGKDGEDGGYYTPGADGYWYFHKDSTDTAGTKTDLKCLPSGAVKATLSEDGKTLTIADATTGEEIAKLDLGGSASLVFIPQALVKGQEGLLYSDLYYTPMNGSSLNSSDEVWKAPSTWTGAKYKHLNTTHSAQESTEFKCRYNSGIAEYHVNAKGVTLDDTFTYEFIWKDLETRAGTQHKAKDFGVKAEFVSCENGVLKVKATVTGTEAWAEGGDQQLLTVVALKATDGKTTVVSDYAAIWGDSYHNHYSGGLYICDDDAAPYRTEINRNYSGYDRYPSTTGKVYTSSGKVWDGTRTNNCDVTVAYNGSIDLKKEVFVNFDDAILSAETLEALGLTWDFSLVKNYKVGTSETDQADFATLTDGMLTPKVYDIDGTAAIGRTPIVRVKLLRGTDVVAVAYIKVYIGSTPDMGSIVLTPTVNAEGKAKSEFTFVNGGDKYYTTVAEVNTKFYNLFDGGKTAFESAYNAGRNVYKDPNNNISHKDYDLNVGTVNLVAVGNSGSNTTKVFEWIVTPAELRAAYKAAQKKGYKLTTLTYTGYFEHKTDATKLYITLTAPVTDLSVIDGYNIPASSYIDGLWASGETSFTFRTPVAGESASTNLGLSVDLYSLFKQNANGQIDIPSYLYKSSGNKVDYFFCNDMVKDANGRTIRHDIGGVFVEFKVADGTLKATEYKSATSGETYEPKNQDIATIVNTGANQFEYCKSDLAKKLLNTGKMFVLIGAQSYILGNETADYTVPITFNGEDHFKANIVSPVKIATESDGKFAAGKNIGEAGTFINLRNVINPTDWRGYAFNATGNDYLWGYYGLKLGNITLAAAECDLSGERAALTSGLELKVLYAVDGQKVNKGTDAAPSYRYALCGASDGSSIVVPAANSAVTAVGDYLTFKQGNVTITKDFNIYVKLKVSYAWGDILTDWITIPVEK